MKLKINLLASWGDHIVGIVIGLFLMPFVLNTVGDGQYGLWLFICSIAGYSGLLNMGFGETISRFVAHHHAKGEIDRINQVINVIGAVYLGICFLVAAAAGVLAWAAPFLYDWGTTPINELRWVFLLLGLNVGIGIVGNVSGGVLVGLQRMDLERGFRTISGIARLIMTCVFLQHEHALLTLAIIFLATTLIENAGHMFLMFRQLPGLKISPKYWSMATLKECSGFSIFALLDGLAGKLIDATDTIVIGIVFGSRYIVPYYVAHRLTAFIVQPLQIIGLVAMPRGAELEAGAHDGQLRVLVRKGLGLSFLLMGGFFIGAWYFGGQVLEAWIGRTYAESHTLLLVLLAAQLIATPMHVLRGVLFGMGHVKVPAILYFIEAIANIGLTLLLVKPFGLLGVALGTAIPIVLVELTVMMPYALKKLGYSMPEFARSILLPLILPLLALWSYSIIVVATWPIASTWLSVLLVAGGGGIVLVGTALAASGQFRSRGIKAAPG